MDIALYLGAHLTDEDKLVRCLMRNRTMLAGQGIAVPGPGGYRRQLRELAQAMRDEPTNGETQEALLDGILEADDVSRVVFCAEQFLAVHRWAIANDRLYPESGTRLAQLRHLFPEARVEAFLTIRNPATFLPMLAHDKRAGGVDAALKGIDPLTVRWSEVLLRMRTEAPDVPITVWTLEDLPVLWPEVLQAVSGHRGQEEFAAWFGFYWDLVTPKSHEAMRRYFRKNPTPDDLSRRRVLRAMLDKFIEPERLAIPQALPGWDGDYIDVLTELYEQDLDLIGSIPGVTLLEP
ncbi:MAG: hypothetical protein KDK01_10735 [Rhodobacteraceae bacterium]|jgi:hypothetical protein|nr:hypothetical protein [Paracoccaceae bacterium]